MIESLIATPAIILMTSNNFREKSSYT